MNGRAILTAGLMLISVSAFGQSVQPGWVADARTGCKVWDANPQPNESISWSGACRNGLAQGRGVLQWFQSGQPAALAKGRWQGGKMNGHGVVTLTNGERFDEQWKDDKRNGHGVYIYANGDRYDGEWRDGKKNGRGTEVRADGSRYAGEWRDNLPNGLGAAAWLNGDSYAGLWIMGCYRNGTRIASWGVDLSSCQ